MLNAKEVLIVILVALFVAGISMEANAEGKEVVAPYDDRYVMCANLAYNAGYVEQGDYYRYKIQPYYESRAIDIAYIDNATVDALYRITSRMDVTLAKAARMYYKLDCEDG